MIDNLNPPEPPDEQGTPHYKVGGPVICSQTDSGKVCPFAEFSLSIVAGDCCGTLSYQWYKGLSGDISSPLVGETTATLTISTTVDVDFWVRITNCHGSFANSDTFEMIVIEVPNIIEQPQSILLPVCTTATVEFSVVVENCIQEDVVTYQWYAGLSGDISNPIVGETTPSLSVVAGTTTDYWVRATSTATGFFSDSDTATVETVFLPEITEQPPLITPASAGGSPTLCVVSANGTIFQWYEGPSGDVSVPISGATGPCVTFEDIQESIDAWVRISNPCGSVDSDVGTILVTDAPEFSAMVSEYGFIGTKDPLLQGAVAEYGFTGEANPLLNDSVVEYGFKE